MLIALRERAERTRASLFFTPMLFVLGAIGLGFGSLALDEWISGRGYDLPGILSSTVGSARALLGTVAGATITVAGIAFSVSLLLIQLASSQFSPRVLYGFFRDRFTKRVMGISLGTFTYSLIVLRGVRAPLEENGATIIPHVSVFVALVLGIAALLAIIAFINHSAHSMAVGEIIRRITEEALAQIRRMCPHAAGTAPKPPVEGDRPHGPPLVVRAAADGWVQQIDARGMLRAVDAGSVIRLDVSPGVFVWRGAAIASVWPAPEDPEPVERAIRGDVRLGRSRTMQQDMALGFRQLVDIALRALSPGVNDPTTAYEAIVHLGTLMHELLGRDLPPRVEVGDDGRRLFRPHDLTHRDFVGLAFDQIRRAGSDAPSVADSLIDVLGRLVEALEAEGLVARTEPLRRQAALVLGGCERAGLLEDDLARIRERAAALGLEPLPA